MLICMDTETTGLDPTKNEIIQLAIVFMDDKIPQFLVKFFSLSPNLFCFSRFHQPISFVGENDTKEKVRISE